MNKLIKQEDAMGCGVASVAFVLNITYGEAAGLFIRNEQRFERGFTSKDITTALASAGKTYQSAYIGRDSKPKIATDSLVYVPKCKHFPRGHYLVKMKNGFMDPFINMHTVNFDYRKAKAGIRRKLPFKISLKIYPNLRQRYAFQVPAKATALPYRS